MITVGNTEMLVSANVQASLVSWCSRRGFSLFPLEGGGSSGLHSGWDGVIVGEVLQPLHQWLFLPVAVLSSWGQEREPTAGLTELGPTVCIFLTGKSLLASFADGVPAVCPYLAGAGKAARKCKCYETDLMTLLSCRESRQS